MMTDLVSRLCRIPRLLADALRSAAAHAPTDEDIRTQDEEIALKVLRKRARGNISLKMGKILTSGFLAERKRIAMTRDFSC